LGREESQGTPVNRFYLFAKCRQRASPNTSQHIDIAPFGVDTPWSELAWNHSPGVRQRAQRGVNHIDADPESERHGPRSERAVGAGITLHQLREGAVGRLGEYRWQAEGNCHPHSISQAAGVLSG